MTQNFINEVYNDDGITRVDSSLLENEGGYIDRDNIFWKPSERMVPDNQKFYKPEQIIDPFGNVTTLEYDDPCLLPEKTTDPLGNERTAENDYRVMKPWRKTNKNGNRQF